jgi:hypothetical protein
MAIGGFEITRGRLQTKYRVVLYGVEGIGKSTFAAQFPNPVFIDTEGSTNTMDVARYPKPASWAMLIGEVQDAIRSRTCQTLVIDTLDWAQKLCTDYLLAANNWQSIETPGYGKGYIELYNEFGKLLNLLSEVVAAGITVVLTAHATIRTVTLPDAQGQYDRYELKLSESRNGKISAMVKEWADLLLFANYETYLVEDKETKKKKATGAQRVMYANHSAAWDAKNRFGLPDRMPFDYSAIAHLFADAAPAPQPQAVNPPTQVPVASPERPQAEMRSDNRPLSDAPQTAGNGPIQPAVTSAGYRVGLQTNAQTAAQHAQPAVSAPTARTVVDQAIQAAAEKAEPVLDLQSRTITPEDEAVMATWPAALCQLMRTAAVTPRDIVNYAVSKGHFPAGSVPANLTADYLAAVIANWDVIMDTINDQTCPF